MHNNKLFTRSLPSLLQEGGYILYARHAEATIGVDQPFFNFQDCSTQRNLCETGRSQALAYGDALRRLRTSISFPVLSSPFCRNIETAVLAFREEYVKVDPFWFEIYKLDTNISAVEQNLILSALTSVLEIQPPPGSNKIIIAHSFPEGIGLGQIPNMGTVVVKPHGPGKGYKVVARISLQELMSWN